MKPQPLSTLSPEARQKRVSDLIEESMLFRLNVVAAIEREIADMTRNHAEADNWWSTRADRACPVFSSKYTCGQYRHGTSAR
jgi:hypothetical protein